MGIKNLWEALSPALETRSLAQIAVSEGFEERRRRDGCVIIGVDASIWLNQAHSINRRKSSGAQGGENPSIRSLFYRLCRLLTLPMNPVFIFDGAQRPQQKRGNKVKTAKPHYLTLPFQKFIEAFGFFHYTAPGEAEAELAELNRRGFIDAVISEDSDAVAFGAVCIFRLKNSKDVGDDIKIFKAETAESNSKVALDRAGLFLMALLCGNDYHKTGLLGCGWKTALKISRTGIAQPLFAAATAMTSKNSLVSFLDSWRVGFQTLLRNDPDGLLRGELFPRLADNTESIKFPSLEAVQLYAQPLTSWVTQQPPDPSIWHDVEPELSLIGELCEKYFSWGSSGEIIKHLQETLCPGVAIRYFIYQQSISEYSRLLDYELDQYTGETPSIQSLYLIKIAGARLGPGPPSSKPKVCGFTVRAHADTIFNKVLAGLALAIKSAIKEQHPMAIPMTFWVPSSILRAGAPSLVGQFVGELPVQSAFSKILPSLIKEDGNTCLDDVSDFSVDYDSCDSDFRNQFLQGSSNNAAFWPTTRLSEPLPCPSPLMHAISPNSDTSRFDGYINLCTPTPPPVPRFLGYINLCTPTPSPSPLSRSKSSSITRPE